jgi:hypothetical protein
MPFGKYTAHFRTMQREPLGIPNNGQRVRIKKMGRAGKMRALRRLMRLASCGPRV